MFWAGFRSQLFFFGSLAEPGCDGDLALYPAARSARDGNARRRDCRGSCRAATQQYVLKPEIVASVIAKAAKEREFQSRSVRSKRQSKPKAAAGLTLEAGGSLQQF